MTLADVVTTMGLLAAIYIVTALMSLVSWRLWVVLFGSGWK